MAKERISEPKDMSTETSQTELQREKKNAKKENIQEQWGSYKRCTILIMGIPEGQERRSVM